MHHEHEPVELRLGQRIGAFLLDGVLRGQDEERIGQLDGAAPPAVTCRSCIACSRAAWVLGGVRLISSASSMLAKIGPLRNSNRRRPVSGSSWRISVPVMSDGIRSGVNWMRWKRQIHGLRQRGDQCVLASPGTPCMRHARGRRWRSALPR